MMQGRFIARGRLLVSTALGMALLATGAMAQETQQTGPGAGDGLLSEVVVTATRQADTVSRVPLSITAVTQRALDQQGVTQLTELTRVVPSLQITTAGAGGSVGQFTIRGVQSSAGAAVTGVYLDDVSLTKRNQNNIAGLNGSPAPPLFDLERVEVLRGPQGTLFGGSSMGGTIRFITPTPSLTTHSGYARVQGSNTSNGDFGYEGGAAFGGPIVEDKLGFRISAFHRKAAGWVDAVNPYTRQVFAEDNNWLKQDVVRAQLLWRPTPDLSILTSLYASREKQNDSSTWTLPVASAADIAATGVIPQRLINGGWGGLQARCNARPVSPTARTSIAAVPCTTPGAFVYAARPQGAYNLEDYQSLRAGPGATSPFSNEQMVASMTADYDFGFANLRLIGAFMQDHQKAITYDTSVVVPLFSGYPFTVPDAPTWNTANGGNFRPNNKRWGNTFEARLSSPGEARPFSYVLGFFYSNIRAHGYYNNIEDVDTPTRLITGLSPLQRYGAPLINGEYATREQNLKDKEYAFFGDLNWWITDEIKATAGVRRASTSFTYRQVFYGTINGNYNPAALAGGITNATVKETPVSPKFALQYQFTENDQVYITAAKGYRSGGVNAPLSQGQCGAALAEFGLSVSDVPGTYESDTIWSYEGGAKLRVLGNRLAVNAAVYRIDWTGLQISVGPNRLGCGQQWVQNLGAARSQGGDLEAQFRVFDGFTVSIAGNYNETTYTEDALGPKPLTGQQVVFARAGESLGRQPWRVNLQAQYNWLAMGQYDAFVRADWTHTPSYDTAFFGQASYTPDNARELKTDLVNFRTGVTVANTDISLFVNNVFNSKDGTPAGGRTGCVAATGAACTDFSSYNPAFTMTTFRPREIGVQANYRF